MATIVATVLADGTAYLLHLSAAGHNALAVPPPQTRAFTAVRVWNHETQAEDAGDAAAAWCAHVLGFAANHVRLVRFNPALRRECNRVYAGDSGAHTLFADGYPLLVASASSLADLNQRMGRREGDLLPMNRFRPNLVLSGLSAWDEDHVDTITIGSVVLRLVKPCVRCQVTTTDQQSGARLSDEPLVTLARFRNNPDFGGVTFGWNAVVLKPGVVVAGDAAVVEYRF